MYRNYFYIDRVEIVLSETPEILPGVRKESFVSI